MRKTLALCLTLTLLCAQALGEAWTYGGSGSDALGEWAVSADGRVVLTGYTDSTDGTLADRTKTDRTGWALCIDGEGNVLWSFCSRLGVHDDMNMPVFHEDGSVTMVLYAEDDGQEIEMIRLDREGEVVRRKTMTRADGGAHIGLERWHTPEGVVIWRDEGDFGIDGCSRFDWDGELTGEADWNVFTGMRSTDGGYAVRILGESGWFCAMDAQGRTTPLNKVFTMREDGLLYGDVRCLLALEDGGAVGAGWVMENPDGAQRRVGRLTRWDAYGSVVFDQVLDCGPLVGVTRAADGFAATAWAEEEGPYSALRPGLLIFFDAQGREIRRETLEPGQDLSYGLPVCTLPDGSVAVLQSVVNEKTGKDVRVTTFPAAKEE